MKVITKGDTQPLRNAMAEFREFEQWLAQNKPGYKC